MRNFGCVSARDGVLFPAGDIVVTVEKNRLVGLSMDRVMAVLKHCMKKSEGTLRCQVFANNVFRYSLANFDGALAMVNACPSSETTLSSARCNFLKTHVLKLWNSDLKDFVSVHVVIFVYPDVSGDGTHMIFYGDILQQLNGHDVSFIDAIEVEKLWQDRTSISVKYHELSVLRRKDLHEGGVLESDAGDSDLEKMFAGTNAMSTTAS